MIIVTDNTGQLIEPLIDIGDDFAIEMGVDGTLDVSFTTFPSQRNLEGYTLLKTNSRVVVEDYEFIILTCDETEGFKTVTGMSTYYLNSKVRQNSIYTGGNLLQDQLAFIFSGTGWTFTVDSSVSNSSVSVPELGDDNVVSLVNRVVSAHAVEFEILPNRTIKFVKKLGGNSDYQFRYKYNVSDVVLKEDITNVYTKITGTFEEGQSVTYISPNASVFGELEATPVTDERFTTSTTMLEHLKEILTDSPDLAIESTAVDLTQRNIGETVWLIYEPLNVEFQTRILTMKKVLNKNELVTAQVVLGTSIPKTINDVVVDGIINQQATEDELNGAKKEYRSSITQLDNQIRLEVERIDQSVAAIDIKADNINISVNNRITNEVAAIDVRANQINLKVDNLATQTNSSINILNNQIQLKVDKGGSITDINLTPGVATINADKINLNGAVMANGSITGSSTINVGTDLTVGNNIYMATGSSGQKSIQFGGVARITGDWSNIGISAPNVKIDSNVVLGASGSTVGFNGTVNFSQASSIVGVARANSSGIGISTSGSKLYVQVNGSTVGTITFD